MPVIQISCLGRQGRLGNQMHQAAFARAYAEAYHCELQIPADWRGRKLFRGWNQFAPIDGRCPTTDLDVIPWGSTDIDLNGFYQNQSAIDLLDRKTLRKWFEFANPLDIPTSPVACHLRRGDYVRNPCFCTVSRWSYERKLIKLGIDPNGPAVAWVSEDSGNDEIRDLHVLMHAGTLLRANSTFSWWAAVLGSNDRVFAPVVNHSTGECDVEFIEGNWPRCCDSMNVGAKVSDLHLKEE